MPKTLIAVDPKKLPWEQATPLHNRWHPEIPAVASVAEGEVFRVETVDWTGGQIKNDDSADDIKHVDLTQVHYLSGPIAVETAQPGDLLKVEILNLGPLKGDEWGFCGTFHKDNGGGFLTDHCARLPALQPLPWRWRVRARVPSVDCRTTSPLRRRSLPPSLGCAPQIRRRPRPSGTLRASTAALATSRACASLGSSTRG